MVQPFPECLPEGPWLEKRDPWELGPLLRLGGAWRSEEAEGEEDDESEGRGLHGGFLLAVRCRSCTRNVQATRTCTPTRSCALAGPLSRGPHCTLLYDDACLGKPNGPNERQPPKGASVRFDLIGRALRGL